MNLNQFFLSIERVCKLWEKESSESISPEFQENFNQMKGEFAELKKERLNLYQEKLDSIYTERNRLAIAFAIMALKNGNKAGIYYDEFHSEWAEEWRYAVIVDISNDKQVSWHMSPLEVDYAQKYLPKYNKKWDGTSTARERDWIKYID